MSTVKKGKKAKDVAMVWSLGVLPTTGKERSKAAKGPFLYSIAKTAEELDEVYKLRYEIYCLETGWLSAKDYPTGREQDSYDNHSITLIAQNVLGHIVGATRLIVSLPSHPLPIQEHFGVPVTPYDVEISRTVCRKNFRSIELVSGLFNMLYKCSLEYSINHMYAILEKPLLRLLQREGFSIREIGPGRNYFGGWTIPVIAQPNESNPKNKGKLIHV